MKLLEGMNKWSKSEKILHITGWAAAVVQIAASIFFMVNLMRVNVLPKDYTIMIGALLILVCCAVVITQHWKIPGIITKVVSVIITVALLFVSVKYIIPTNSAIGNVVNNKSQTQVGIYTLKSSGLDSLDSVKDLEFGYVDDSNKSMENALEMLSEDLGGDVKSRNYDNAESLADALYSGEVKVILLNTAMISLLSNHTDFENETNCIKKYVIEFVYQNTNNEEYLSGDDILALYVSGIDVAGSPSENRNSDVNILVVVNKKTNQILMINTPRDFYVPTTESVAHNGLPDKLTHAGCYGIDCSIGTLEMLYGINIDYYIKLNFTGFVEVIDRLGGIDVESEFDFVTTHGGDHIVAGMNHLNGTQALGFARERYAFATGDRQRGKNHMIIITAMMKKLMSSDILKNYSEILEALSESMVTSMPKDEIGNFVKYQLNKMPSWDIMNYSVNGSGDNLLCYSLSAPNYVMIPDQATVDQAKAYLTQIFNNEKITVE